jgi:hypothetical protein
MLETQEEAVLAVCTYKCYFLFVQYILLLKRKQQSKQDHQGAPATSAGTQVTTALQATLPIKRPQMSSLLKNLTSL